MEKNLKDANISKNRTLIIEYKTISPYIITKNQMETNQEYFNNFKDFKKRAKEIIENSNQNNYYYTALTYEIKFHTLITLVITDKENKITKMYTDLFDFDTIKEVKQWIKKEDEKWEILKKDV